MNNACHWLLVKLTHYNVVDIEYLGTVFVGEVVVGVQRFLIVIDINPTYYTL